jgi:hypothetical protein
VQIEYVERIPAAKLFKDDETAHAESIVANVKPEQMILRAPGLYECVSDSAFLFLPPVSPRGVDAPTFVCRVVFRPVAYRNKPKPA